ncbi:MAG: DUF488 family protein [Phycisphaerales bacterium]|nr:DUF488 family protein [Phycisphaerales bacterium]
MARVQFKRIYDPIDAGDGFRVLVDRLWPRGLTRADAKLDRWMKEISPSTELRLWYRHDPARWPEFRKRYRAELKGSTALAELRSLARTHKVITLLSASKERDLSHAVVLRGLLLRSPRRPRQSPASVTSRRRRSG